MTRIVEEDIRAGVLAKTLEDKMQVLGVRAEFAVKNYGRLGSSWAEFYGRDIPYLLAELREAREEIASLKEDLAFIKHAARVME